MTAFDRLQGSLLASSFDFARTRVDPEGESDVFTSPSGLSIVVRLNRCPVVPGTLVADGISLESGGETIALPEAEAEQLQVLLWEKIDHEDQFFLSYAYGRPPGLPSPEAGEVIPSPPMTAFEPDLTP
jgi:hypothetical protein